MIRLAVCGAAGRMGQRILSLAAQQPEVFSISGALDSPNHPLLNKTLSEVCSINGCEVTITDNPGKFITQTDTVIDFSTPESTMAVSESCCQAKTPLVVGTTGLSEPQLKSLEAISKSIPLVLAPNMSVGVNLLFGLVSIVASILNDEYDIEITETHHRFKKDAPSGTAKKLAQVAAEARKVDLANFGCYGREGISGERKRGEIGVHAIRMGNVVGDHTVSFSNLGERLELTHKAESRDTFALGSLKAAEFVAKAKPGLYDMRDVLGLNFNKQ